MDALGGGSEAPEGELAGEFLEFELTRPGAPSRVERRALFNWLDSAGQIIGLKQQPDLAVMLASKTDVLVLGAQPTEEFASHLLVASLKAQVAEPLAPAFPNDVWALALARQQWVAALRIPVFMNRANVITHHSGLRSDAVSVLAPADGFDIVANEMDAVADKAADALRARVMQGVADTNVELLASNDLANASNVAEALTIVPAVSDWRLVQGSVPDDLRARLGKDLSTTMVSDLENGFLAIFLRDPGKGHGHAGHWRIDASTGSTLGITRRGWGGVDQADTEYLALLSRRARDAYRIIKVIGWRGVRQNAKIVNALGCYARAASRGSGYAWCAVTSTLSAIGYMIPGAFGEALSALGDLGSAAGSWGQ